MLLNLRQKTPDYITECLQQGETLSRLKWLEKENVQEAYLAADKEGQPVEMQLDEETQGYNGPI